MGISGIFLRVYGKKCVEFQGIEGSYSISWIRSTKLIGKYYPSMHGPQFT